MRKLLTAMAISTAACISYADTLTQCPESINVSCFIGSWCYIKTLNGENINPDLHKDSSLYTGSYGLASVVAFAKTSVPENIVCSYINLRSKITIQLKADNYKPNGGAWSPLGDNQQVCYPLDPATGKTASCNIIKDI